MVLWCVECVEVEEAGLHSGPCHFFEAEFYEFCPDFFEEIEVGVFFSWPSFGYWCFYVAFLEFDGLPFSFDDVLWRELCDFFGCFCVLLECCFALVCEFENSCGFVCCG